jgi:hypothetical protein
VTSYRLNGLLSFRKGGAAFLIPCFTAGNSNATFTQEIDGQGKITRFLPIGADHYYCDRYAPSGIARQIGEEGVFAARLNDGAIHVGSFDALRRDLATVDLEQLGSSFFNVDALAFVGDLTGRDRAVYTASMLFRDHEIGKEWRRLETCGRVAGLDRAVLDHSANTDDPTQFLSRANGQRASKAGGSFRREIARRVSNRLSTNLLGQRGSLFESADGAVRAVVSTSRRYHRRYQAYWYCFYDTQREYLRQASSSYLVLSGADTGRAWAIPISMIEPFFSHMNVTKRPNKQTYWHIITKLDGDNCVLVAGNRDLDITLYEV